MARHIGWCSLRTIPPVPPVGIYSCGSTGFVAFANTLTPISEDWHKVFLVGLPETYGIPEFRVNVVPEPSVLSLFFVALALVAHTILRPGLKCQRASELSRAVGPRHASSFPSRSYVMLPPRRIA